MSLVESVISLIITTLIISSLSFAFPSYLKISAESKRIEAELSRDTFIVNSFKKVEMEKIEDWLKLVKSLYPKISITSYKVFQNNEKELFVCEWEGHQYFKEVSNVKK